MQEHKHKDKRKILVIDIEWEPALAYVWQMWKVNINPDMLISHGGMLCFCAHWVGSKEYMFFSKWEHGRKGMAEAAKRLITEADAVVHYNGDRYDMPKITGEIILAELDPPPKPASIDLMKTVKKFGFNMNRLAYVAPLLNVGNKLSHEGFILWKKVMDGDKAAQKRMQKYCVQDVKVTAKLYERILPFITNHPVLNSSGSGVECPNCTSKNTQKRGTRSTRYCRIQRNQCQDCGTWFETTRTRIKTNANE
jgi:hypothetical protein